MSGAHQPVRPSSRSGVPSSRARFERRAAQVRRQPLRLVGMLVGLLVILLVLGWLVGFSPLLSVRAVTVVGLSDPGERAAAAAAARIPMGTPLVRIDTGAAASRVEAVATVMSASVDRSWPTTVTVTVHRRVPVLAVKDPRGQLQVVDKDGVSFQTVQALPAGVAVVNATTSAPDPEGLRAAISVLGLLPAAERATVTDVTVTSADLVTFRLGALTVIWGGVADGPKKLRVLSALRPTNPAVIDVSAPDTPVTR